MGEKMMHEPKDSSNDDSALQPSPVVIFSLVGGFVWASLPREPKPIRLGEYEPVKAMMQDFLDQSALGDRLAGRSTGNL